jgi:Glycoside hydrolase 123, catalytic domain
LKLLPLLLTAWIVDDGEKIERHAPPQPSPPLELFALRDEVIAFQVVVPGPLDGVTVEISADFKTDLFIEHFFEVRRSSTGGQPWSLGWAKGSGPGNFVGTYPDALIPIELAPPWNPWPMKVPAGENGVVWVDLTVPKTALPGRYHGTILVRAGDGADALPFSLDVLDATLPPRPVSTLLFYDPGNLRKRVGPNAERQLWTLFHEHRVTPLHGINDLEDLQHHLPALAEDDLVVFGVYGTLGDPTPEKAALVEGLARRLPAGVGAILYAEDEDCRSPRGAGWRKLLSTVRVAWTCSEDPRRQPVDVPIVAAGEWDATKGRTWIYNGYRPATGALHSDTPATDLRTFGWIAAMAGIPRWFIWETTFWYDSNRGGHGPYDPFVSAETFHNRDSEAGMGDGVLVYPGRQLDRFGEHSLGFEGVLPSIRLKNLRRGIEDAGYLQLARAADPAAANAIARKLFPRILAEARRGDPPSWPERGRDFLEARRALSQLIAFGADPGPPPPAPRSQPWWPVLLMVAASLALIAWARKELSS